MRTTHIICTIGPASDSPAVLRAMAREGMTVARLNFSHSSLADHLRRLETIRSINRKFGRRVKILQDLEGYRIRVGALRGGAVTLREHARVEVTTLPLTGGAHRIPLDYEGPLDAVRPGSYLYIDDGTIVLRAVRCRRQYLSCSVIVGGLLKERKGVNIPGMRLAFEGLTAKDRRDVEFAIAHDVEYVAQSFVRDERDMACLARCIGGRLPKVRLIAKIENRQGIRNLEAILRVSDGIMIARGDMGVSLPIYEIPVIQKRIIRACNDAGKPVITATQMLESMIHNLRPTRAETTDVANAVLDGSDFVMLSAETAVGEHPVETVRMMRQIITFARRHEARGRIRDLR